MGMISVCRSYFLVVVVVVVIVVVVVEYTVVVVVTLVEEEEIVGSVTRVVVDIGLGLVVLVVLEAVHSTLPA